LVTPTTLIQLSFSVTVHHQMLSWDRVLTMKAIWGVCFGLAIFLAACFEPPCEGVCTTAPDSGKTDSGMQRSDGSVPKFDSGISFDSGTAFDSGFDAAVPTVDSGMPLDTGAPNVDSGCVQVPSGLVSWWPADGNANDIAGSNSGTIGPGGQFVAGKIGQAFFINGANGIVSTPTVNFPTGTSDRTLELWIRNDAMFVPGNDPVFAGYGGFGTNNAIYAVGALGTTTQSFFSQWGQALLGTPVPIGQWIHVAATTQNSLTKLYINGELAAAGSLAMSTPSSSTMFLGGVGGPLGDTRRFKGSIDEASIYNRVLTNAEILSLVQAPLGKCR
jgi:hypothetical protein